MSAPEARTLGASTAAMLVVASMVGTGVFTSTGFLVGDIGSKPAVLFAWILGGALALAGALSYAELGAALPANGGEYQLLSRIYHPAVGFLAGLTSMIIGFAAPIASASVAFARYLDTVVPGLPERPVAAALILAMTLLHSTRVETGSRLQDWLTYGKIGLIAAFLALGAFAPLPHFGEAPRVPLGAAIASGSFAVGQFWIAFSYSGWNAASYVAGELKDPARNLPRALISATIAVTVLYTALNFVYLAAAPADALAGQLQVAYVAATHMMGETASRFVSAVIALGLVSTTGAFVMTGPRVLAAVGVDYPRLALLTRRREGGAPVVALALQAALSLGMLFTASFEVMIESVGFVLSFWAGLAVLGVIVLRRREPTLPRPYKTLGYPVTPLVFVALMGWIIVRSVISKPEILVWGALALVASLAIWLWARPRDAR